MTEQPAVDAEAPSTAYGALLPAKDRDSRPFWAALRAGHLLLQRCAECATLRFPPRCVCNACGSWDTTWDECGGTGTVFAWSVVHHPLTVAYSAAVPYHLLAVRLTEQDDVILPGALVGGTRGLVTGAPVRAGFHTVGPELTLLVWRLAGPVGLVTGERPT